MNIKEFIEKAIEGGWNTSPRFRDLKTKMSDVRLTTAREMVAWQEIAQDYMQTFALLDPLAWRAVGKVEGWGEEVNSYIVVDGLSRDLQGGKLRQLKFISLLQDGKPLETALAEATSN